MFLAFFDNVKKFANQYFQYFDFINIFVISMWCIYYVRSFIRPDWKRSLFLISILLIEEKTYVHIILIYTVLSLISVRQNVLLINVLIHFNWVTFILAVKFAVKQADNSQNCISKEQWAGSCSFLAPGLKKIGWTDCYKYDMSHHQVFNETLISKKLLSVL